MPLVFKKLPHIKNASLELELIHKAQNGDSLALRRLIQCNTGLVMKEANRHRDKGVAFDDLVQEGLLGLHHAVIMFDASYGFRLSTYAFRWINQRITRCVARDARSIRLPVALANMIPKMFAIERAYINKNSEPLPLKQLAKELDITLEKLQVLKDNCAHVYSLDYVYREEGNGNDLNSLLPTEVEEDVYQELEQSALHLLLQQVMSEVLTDVEADCLYMLFGLADGTCYKYEDIGTVLNMTKQGANTAAKRAKMKLAQSPKLAKYREFLT